MQIFRCGVNIRNPTSRSSSAKTFRNRMWLAQIVVLAPWWVIAELQVRAAKPKLRKNQKVERERLTVCQLSWQAYKLLALWDPADSMMISAPCPPSRTPLSLAPMQIDRTRLKKTLLQSVDALKIKTTAPKSLGSQTYSRLCMCALSLSLSLTAKSFKPKGKSKLRFEHETPF